MNTRNINDKNIKRKLVQVRNKIRAKLDAIKSGQIEVEHALQPLRHLIQKSTEPKIKEELIKTKKEVFQSQKTPKKEIPHKILKETSTSPINLESQFTDDNDADTTIYSHTPEYESYFFDDTFTTQPEKSIVETIPEESFYEYLEQYDELPRTFISGFIRDTDNVFDHHYLSHDHLTDRFHFGDSELNFKGPDIIIKGKIYKGTPGLYELIFINKPNSGSATKEDLENFRDIVLITNAHKRNFKSNEQIAGNRGEKYKFVIKPILNALEKENAEVEKIHKTKLRIPVRKGRGLLMQYNERPIEYVHWDDPNELVERLKLLVASQMAGNNNHTNEINSIIEELKEVNLIE